MFYCLIFFIYFSKICFFYLLTASSIFVTQNSTSRYYREQWGTECLTYRFLLPTLLYGVKHEAVYLSTFLLSQCRLKKITNKSHCSSYIVHLGILRVTRLFLNGVVNRKIILYTFTSQIEVTTNVYMFPTALL